jgi:hypothetical protein
MILKTYLGLETNVLEPYTCPCPPCPPCSPSRCRPSRGGVVKSDESL